MRDVFETTDGARPEPSPLSPEACAGLPLGAFAVLHGGDAFDPGATKTKNGEAEARSAIAAQVRFEAGASAEAVARVVRDMVAQLAGNPILSSRLGRAKPLRVLFIPADGVISGPGYPATLAPQISGLYWDRREWDSARIILRLDRLLVEPGLVFHEMAHALHALTFTKAERQLISTTLLPTYGSDAAVDEVFAIYSERELGPAFTADELRAPGVYGEARRRWSEDHLFTRFVRRLYAPHKPAAGPGMPSSRPEGWMKRLSRR